MAFLIGSGLLVGAMGDNVFSQSSVAVYFWIMAGLVMAIDRHMLPNSEAPDLANDANVSSQRRSQAK